MTALYALEAIGLAGVALAGIALLIGIILLARHFLNRESQRLRAEASALPSLIKKHPALDLRRFRLLFGLTGLSLSLAVVLCAFEMPSFTEVELVSLSTLPDDPEEMLEIPATVWKQPPPPPKVKQPEIKVVEDNTELPEVAVDLTSDIAPDDLVLPDEVANTAPAEEIADDSPMDFVETSATPVGGMEAFYRFLSKNMDYPRQARRMGVEGRVFIRFVVERDGSLSNLEAIRGVGAGCDEEALRVLKLALRWNPGKQRGRPVRQRMVIPVNFVLN